MAYLRSWHFLPGMTDDKTVEQVLTELQQFTGTTRHYRSSFGSLLLTDGVHYLRETLNCYWLIDIVESYQPLLRGEEFQLWGIQVNDDQSAVVEMRQDSGLEPLVQQEIAYSDFKLREYEFYCIQGVVLLKSEY